MFNKKKNSVAHVMQDITWYLNRRIVPHILERMPGSKFFLMPGGGRRGGKMLVEDNLSWIGNLDEENFGGVIEFINKEKRFLWMPRFLRVRLLNFLPGLTFSSWVRIFKGPKNWVFHGAFLNFTALFLFRIIGKRIAFLNWSGPGAGVGIPRNPLGRLETLKWKLCSAVFVLMSPEVRYFIPFLNQKKIRVLPYPANSSKSYDDALRDIEELPRNRVMLLGNNALRMEYYPAFLEKVRDGEWDKIICMLNYGNGGQWKSKSDISIDEFESNCKKRFGDVFYPWKNVLPYEEYSRLMKSASVYCCPVEIQSGLGAANLCVLQGKAVFLCGDNYEWYKELGVKVFHIREMERLSIDEILRRVPSKEELAANILALKKAHYETYGKDYWISTIKDTFNIK